ncbi:hypothetical protein GLOTRDRAFT_138863 [Gloeophyllum trabeum ATCC 11539]|uniref:Uncharacterized protein n=1 Tax=Gloeophyllum trabeum (strain ATCC 11539 / FP-39264 / Madison 617) TaxID=670483 RepID=S7RQS0_GLOTA|nr:uncharacterized protein GLOTRDRAFT_138863 [Gloeophyllum trabeum ATCC 11539]EPQ55259.1 hypothetical protein GLOTRDRAFT_138863 [Gloeophyllum trabeum ATCC 11539]
MASQTVNGGVLAGIIVAVVVAVLLLVIIVVPLARRRMTQVRLSKVDVEQQSGKVSHTRTKSALDAELPLLNPVSPLFGESGNLPSVTDHDHGKESSDHTAEKGFPQKPRSHTSHRGSPEYQESPPPSYHPPVEQASPGAQVRAPIPLPSQPPQPQPVPGAKASDNSSRSKSRARLGLRRAPMETLVEQSDLSSGDDTSRARTLSPEGGLQIPSFRRPSAMARLVTQPLTTAFRNSLRSISTQSTASSPSSSGALHHYPSFTASTATYATAAEEFSPNDSRTDVSLRSQPSNSRPPRALRPGASAPPTDSRSSKRAHLRPSDAIQTPTLHETRLPLSMPRQASINFVGTTTPGPGRTVR